MRNLTALLLLASAFVFSQEKKYQSLLWEISGNGLKKKSYVYGTMHVSDKVSYHLSDVFFEKLLEVDVVANESEPRTWKDVESIIPDFQLNYNGYAPFYSQFYIKPINQRDLKTVFRNNNFNLIQLLSRTNQARQDFQEETYLDMFIYRVARKHNKKTIGLEDVKETLKNMMSVAYNQDFEGMQEKRQLLQKLLKDKSQFEVMMEAYRDKDLDLLDTLTVLTSTKENLKITLYDRNHIMVKSMDSVMKNSSLFSAIGAAHLPGKNGVIELLRSKGYTVKPLLGKYTEKGKQAKKSVENLYVKPNLVVKSTKDNMITLPMFEHYFERGNGIESADLVNGGILSVKRLSKKDFLSKSKDQFNIKSLDSLFFENIPGEIQEKNELETSDYFMYDIKSKTKTGDALRYRYYITPIEIIAVLMSGEKDFVTKLQNEVFDQIKLKPYTQTDQNINFKESSFEVIMPSYHIINGGLNESNHNNDFEIIGYDKKNNSMYFLNEKSLTENNNLQETEFELKRIPFEVLRSFKLDTISGNLSKDKTEFLVQSKQEDKKIWLKTIIKGHKYYVLGTVNASEKASKTYFDSFKTKRNQSFSKTKVYKDTIAHFSINLPEKEVEKQNFKFDDRHSYLAVKNDNQFWAVNKSYEFLTNSNRKIELTYEKSHKYQSYKNIDSLLFNLKKGIKENRYINEEDYYSQAIAEAAAAVDSAAAVVDSAPISKLIEQDDVFNPLHYDTSNWFKTYVKSEEKDFTLVQEKTKIDKENDAFTYEVLATKENSKQATKIKVIFRKDETYILSTLVSQDYQNDDDELEEIFTSLKLEDHKKSRSVFENKFSLFEEDIKSEHDSIRKSASESFMFLDFEDGDALQLIKFYKNHQFLKDQFELKNQILSRIAGLKTQVTVPFLKEIYKNPKTSSDEQFLVLEGLAFQENKESYELIKELMEYDLPISDDEYKAGELIDTFNRDLKNSYVLYPDILQYYNVKEYQSSTVNFVESLIAKNLVKYKALKPYKKMLLTNAKLEYKRVLSWKNKSDNQDDSDVVEYAVIEDNYNTPQVYNLNNYLSVLKPLNDSAITELKNKANQLDIDEILVFDAERDLREKGKVDPSIFNQMIVKKSLAFKALKMANHNSQQNLISSFSNEDILKMAIEEEENSMKKDSLIFLEKRNVQHKGNNLVFSFYKKIHKKDDKEDYYTTEDMVFAFAFGLKADGKIDIKSFNKTEYVAITDEENLEDLKKDIIENSLKTLNNRSSSKEINGRLDYLNYLPEYQMED